MFNYFLNLKTNLTFQIEVIDFSNSEIEFSRILHANGFTAAELVDKKYIIYSNTVQKYSNSVFLKKSLVQN